MKFLLILTFKIEVTEIFNLKVKLQVFEIAAQPKNNFTCKNKSEKRNNNKIKFENLVVYLNFFSQQKRKINRRFVCVQS